MSVSCWRRRSATRINICRLVLYRLGHHRLQHGELRGGSCCRRRRLVVRVWQRRRVTDDRRQLRRLLSAQSTSPSRRHHRLHRQLPSPALLHLHVTDETRSSSRDPSADCRRTGPRWNSSRGSGGTDDRPDSLAVCRRFYSQCRRCAASTATRWLPRYIGISL